MVQIQPFWTRDKDKYKIESETIVKKHSNIDKEVKKLKQHEEEIVSKRVFDDKITLQTLGIAKPLNNLNPWELKKSEFVEIFTSVL